MKKTILFFAGAVLSIGLLTACSDSKDGKDMKDTSDSMSMKDTSDSMAMKDSSDSDDAMMDSDGMMGMFEGVDKHKVSGDIKIEDGKLKLMNFKTDEGPDLHVYIAKNGDVEDAVDLGKVESDKMDQTFDLKDVKADDYNSVLIYCNQAHELFGKAMYETKMGMASEEAGKFMGLDDKMVAGMAKIDGNKLMLSDFKTDKGPDLHVYLMKNNNIDESVDLGKIDLEKADQTFTIPGDTKIMDYDKVGIYCNEAHVLFGEATL